MEIIPGTPIQVQLLSTFDTDKDVNNGRATVANHVYNNEGYVIIRAGTPVLLEVTKRNNRPLGRPAVLNIKCVSTRAVDGQPVWLSGELTMVGDRHTGRAIGYAIGLGLTVLPGFGFLFLLVKGDEVVLSQGAYMPDVIITLPPEK